LEAAGVLKEQTITISIIVFLILSSFGFLTETNEHNVYDTESIFHEIDDSLADADKTENFSSQASRGSRANYGVEENNDHGGSWVDNFQNANGIESTINSTFENNNFRQSASYNKFNDSFEGTDGMHITTYDSDYTYYTNHPTGTVGAELDTAQAYDGSSSLIMYESIHKYNLMVNRTVNYNQSIVDMTCYIRIYTWGTSHPNRVGCSYALKFFSGDDLLSLVQFYGGPIRYVNGTTVYNSGSTVTHNTWYKVQMIAFKEDGIYSKYRFSVWNTNNLKTPIATKTGINVYSTGHTNIDKFNLHVANVWDHNLNCWFDGLNLTSRGFYQPGYIQSKSIKLPENRYWDSVFINKTEPTGTEIEVNILNANTDQIIYGPVTINGDFNIRDKVDSDLYKSIKLNATLRSNGARSPILNTWGVSWNASNTWRDTFFGGEKGNVDSLTKNDGECWLYNSPTNWQKYTNNPIVSDGPSSSFDDNGAVYPHVLFNGTDYLMYYTGFTSSSWKIGMATSKNGISWTKYSGNPVLQGSWGEWDSTYVGRPSVIYTGTEYIMWYQGKSSSGKVKIGLATSDDGFNWQKFAGNPVIDLGSSGNWDDDGVNAPNVIFDGLKYKTWYTGFTSGYNAKIGYAMSYDCINWTRYPNNPLITGPGGSAAGAGNLHAIPYKNGFLGWYNNDFGSYAKIYHAYSSDEVSWNIYTNNPVVPRGPSGTWDAASVHSPNVMVKGKQFWMYYAGRNNGGIQQIGLAKTKFNQSGEYLSNPITPNGKFYYNKLIINKNQPAQTWINVSILDGITLQSIPGFESFSSKNMDLSSISPIDHPSIIIKAKFDSNQLNTPILYDWSINWTRNTPPKIINVNSQTIVNRTHTTPIIIDLEDAEELENKLCVKVEYQRVGADDWVTQFLSPISFKTDHWECYFSPPIDAEVGLYEFRFICNDSYLDEDRYLEPHYIYVRNNDPIIWEAFSSSGSWRINRTETMKVMVDASDIETSRTNLDIIVKIKPPHDYPNWESSFVFSQEFYNDLWELSFKPLTQSALGKFEFNITCNDSISEVYTTVDVWVLNNIPLIPEISILPPVPTTSNDLSAEVENAFDIEKLTKYLDFWYSWYKDDEYMPGFENETIIPSSETTKGETWRCEVRVHDGDDVSLPGFNETIIQNSPPELVEQFDTFEMFEDTPVILEYKLSTIFNDADQDELTFYSASVDTHKINIKITQENGTIELIPGENWFGTEEITLYANDSFSVAAEETVKVTVKPTNDPPIILQVGDKITAPSLGYPELEFEVNQNEWLNITLLVEDIDGDVERGRIQYVLNVTEQEQLYFLDLESTLIFHPNNDMIGWHYINISITDNNETPIEYVNQHIRIRVKNINDPPEVRITSPRNGIMFNEGDLITFNCIADDIDFLVPEAQESLYYQWSTNSSDYLNLGADQILENVTLPPGNYNITVKVIDSGNLEAIHFIHISVFDLPEDDSGSSLTISQLWIWLVLIIILIIIVCIIAFLISRKKKRKMAAPETTEQVLLPDAAYRPPGLPAAPAYVQGAQLTQPQVIQRTPIAAQPTTELLGPTTATAAAATAQPTPQLPPVYSTTMADDTEEPLTYQEKLDLLVERLIRGEIDQELFENLKARFEIESQQTMPTPQLPPASTPVVTEPTPTIAPQPQVTPEIVQPTIVVEPTPQPITLPQPTLIEEPPSMDAPPPDIVPEPVKTAPEEQTPGVAQQQPQIQPQPQVIQPTIKPPEPQIQKPPEPIDQTPKPSTEEQDTNQKSKNQDED
jgi:predicted GH43/DUF377 family glycosyl hydrolase